MKILKAALLVGIVSQSINAMADDVKMRSYDISHDKASKTWMEASPLGNGRIGAMVNGGVKEEIIRLNEDTLWSGEPKPHLDGKKHKDHLEQVRKLIFAGKHAEANKLGQQTMTGEYGEAMLPMGNLKLTMPNIDPAKVSKYNRILNLNKAVSITKFSYDGVDYKRSVFISYPDQTLVVSLESSKAGAITLNATLDSLIKHELKSEAKSNRLWMTGRAPIHADAHYMGKRVVYDKKGNKGMRFATLIQVDQTGGKVTTKNGVVSVIGADAVTIKLTAATSYNGFDKSPSAEGKNEKKLAESALNKIKGDTAQALFSRHVKDYSALFSKVDIQLGDSDKQGKPVYQRTKANCKGVDPDLDELFYQFGRYLIISSSRQGSQPANLQGIWTRKMNPSWSANWTVNCNAQFNYIGTGASGLADLREPFQRLVQEASVDGAKVAKSWYGSKGWVFHHNIDLWRRANPSGGSILWATFPIGGSWSTVELYDLWKFNYRESELKELWPTMKGNVEFWIGNLATDPDTGLRVSCPDVYFENHGLKPNGKTALLTSAPISSTIIIRQSFMDLIEAAKILKLSNDPVVEEAKKVLAKMPKIEVGPNGEIRQWDRDVKNEWKEVDPTQLLVIVGAIYSNQIDLKTSPKLAKALKLMLERRKSGLAGQGSWRLAFPANAYARLGMGNEFHKSLQAHYKVWANENLTARFLQSEWMIDGNLGAMGALQECLVQSQTDEIVLLPALPDAWKAKGFVKGMAVRGGGTVSFSWKDGIVTDWKISGMKLKSVKVRVNGKLESQVK